eukprot:1783315-Pleurochrysis_carterae.AAC.2
MHAALSIPRTVFRLLHSDCIAQAPHIAQYIERGIAHCPGQGVLCLWVGRHASYLCEASTTFATVRVSCGLLAWPFSYRGVPQSFNGLVLSPS